LPDLVDPAAFGSSGLVGAFARLAPVHSSRKIGTFGSFVLPDLYRGHAVSD
jgi:hypothetical protein